jgi:hypothetical protein
MTAAAKAISGKIALCEWEQRRVHDHAQKRYAENDTTNTGSNRCSSVNEKHCTHCTQYYMYYFLKSIQKCSRCTQLAPALHPVRKSHKSPIYQSLTILLPLLPIKKEVLERKEGEGERVEKEIGGIYRVFPGCSGSGGSGPFSGTPAGAGKREAKPAKESESGK